MMLNSKFLIPPPKADRPSAENFQPKSIIYNEKAETATFTFSKKLPKGRGVLSLKFKGLLTDKLKGFYLSKYKHQGKEKHIATTQFEPTDARRAFPCFDEPAQKAVFEVSLKTPKNLTAISNTIETEILEHEGGYKVVNFAPSPKMSTYLLAFIVGDFEFIQARSKDNVLVRVFVTPGKKSQGQFALNTAIRALEFYNNYFDIPYPLPVLDLIALPDFASAAMENWGAITYRETALLVDEKQTSAANKQWVAIVIAHEIAHQWFGNLVTMDWWTDLWLNEGFASYMEYLATDKLFPKWQMWEQYVSGRQAVALRLDALGTSHPIEITVRHPDEISEIFDQVSYAKGSVVIRMLANYLGETVFRDGLRHYLKKHSYGNTVTEDLWKSFEAVSKKPVSKMMKLWTKKTGYPLISAVREGQQTKLSQQRFFSSSLSGKKNRDNTVWKVPLEILNYKGQKNKFLLDKKSGLIGTNGKGWLKINHGETALVRVKYSAGMLNEIKSAIASRKLGPIDRLGIIRDAFGLAEAGHMATVEALELAKFYGREEALPVWEEISSGVALAGGFYKDEKWYKHFRNYALGLHRPLALKLGWEKKKNESHATGLLRGLALFQAGNYGDTAVIKKAQALFAAHLKGRQISPDVRGVVYNLVAQNGGLKQFSQMVGLYKKASQHEEQDRIGRALGSFQDKTVLKKVLEFALSKNVRAQDSPSVFIGVGRNFYGADLAWEFLKNNWDEILKRYNVGGHLLEWFIVPFGRFYTTAQAKDFKNFFKKHPTPNVSRAISQVLEKIYSNEAWIKRDGKNVGKWLEETINN